MTSNGAGSYIRLHDELSQCPDCQGGGKVAVTVWPGTRGESLASAHVPPKLELERCKTCGGSGRVPIGLKYPLRHCVASAP